MFIRARTWLQTSNLSHLETFTLFSTQFKPSRSRQSNFRISLFATSSLKMGKHSMNLFVRSAQQIMYNSAAKWSGGVRFETKLRYLVDFKIGNSRIFFNLFLKIIFWKVFFVLLVPRNGVRTPQAHQKPWFVQQTFHAWIPLVIFNKKNSQARNPLVISPETINSKKGTLWIFSGCPRGVVGLTRNPKSSKFVF